MLLAAGGLALWCLYLWRTWGNPLLFAETESAPGWDQAAGFHTWLKIEWFNNLAQAPQWLHDSIWRLDVRGYSPWSQFLYTVGLTLQAALVFGAIALIPRVLRRFGWGYAVYVLVVVGIPLLGSKDFQGTGRYMLAAFPCFLVVAEWLATRVRWRRTWFTVSVVLLVFWTSLFAGLLRGLTGKSPVVAGRRRGRTTLGWVPQFSSITIFFPAWNEEETIQRAVDAACEAGDELVDAGEIGGYEVLIIDDASTDATGAIADKLAVADRRVRVVHHADQPQARRHAQDRFRRGHRRPRPLHRRRPAVRHGRGRRRPSACCASTRPTSSAPSASTAPARAHAASSTRTSTTTSCSCSSACACAT